MKKFKEYSEDATSVGSVAGLTGEPPVHLKKKKKQKRKRHGDNAHCLFNTHEKIPPNPPSFLLSLISPSVVCHRETRLFDFEERET